MKKIINELSVFLSGNNQSRAIIFIHGFPYDHLMWKEQVEEFSKDYLCVSYDIRGLGSSPVGDGQFTVESFVDDLEKIIEELKTNKPILCGLSMGGYISLRALERMQETFSAVILCDTKSEADNNEGKLKRAAGIKRINEEGLAPFAKEFISNCFGDDFKQNRKDELQKIIECEVPKDVEIFKDYHGLLVTLAKKNCFKKNPDCGSCPLNIYERSIA